MYENIPADISLISALSYSYSDRRSVIPLRSYGIYLDHENELWSSTFGDTRLGSLIGSDSKKSVLSLLEEALQTVNETECMLHEIERNARNNDEIKPSS
jgi:hypothetical protein